MFEHVPSQPEEPHPPRIALLPLIWLLQKTVHSTDWMANPPQFAADIEAITAQIRQFPATGGRAI